MAKYYEENTFEFEFIRCRETKKIEEAISCWVSFTDRPPSWDFDLENPSSSKFGKKDIKDGKAKIVTVGGLRTGILPIKNENNRITSYFVWSSQVSDAWKQIPGNFADSCIKKSPPFNPEELLEKYNKFLLADSLDKALNNHSNKSGTKIKI